ncbi:MAG: histidine phosphatase family protein [Clostridia bacterium]|nr:histidine phosphatase family protein [Clostridia bacterium]
MTTLILIRHGQSVANIKSLFAGHSDVELSELGKEQAQATADYIFKTYKVDKVYASDLQRAYFTGKATADRFGLNVEKTDRMREIFAGEWECKQYEWLAQNDSEAYDCWLHDTGNSRCPGGESVAQLGRRVYDALLKIAQENDGKTVVVATHATPIRVMECMCQNISLDQMKDVPWVSNASVTELQYDQEKWNYVKRGYDAHLGEIKTKLPANV